MSDRPPIPESVSGCAVESTLREGPATVVARARDGLGLPVDLHFFHAETVQPHLEKSVFFDQVRATAAIRSDRLCAVVNAGEKGPWWFVATKGADGATLANLFTRGHLDEERALGIFAAAADGLAALEGARLRHGALEPRAITLPGAGQVLLTLRRLVPLELAGRETCYLSPEEARGEDWGVASDLFTLGLLLFEALHGRPALEGTPDEVRVRLARGIVPQPAALLRGVLPHTVELLSSMLSPDPRLRPPSAAEAARRMRILQAAFNATETLEGSFEAPVAAIPVAPPPPAAVAAAPAAPPAPPTPPAPSLRSRRASARLVLPHRGVELIHEILDPATFLGPTPEGRIVAKPEPFPGAVARLDSGVTADFLVPTGGSPAPLVGGQPFQRREMRYGDVIQIGREEVLFEKAEKLLPEGAEGTDQERAHHLRRRPSRAPVAVGVLLCLGVGTWGGLRVAAARGSRQMELDGMRQRGADAESRFSRVPPLPPEPPAAERAAREETGLRLLDAAREDLDAKRFGQGREKLEALVRQYPDTGASLLAREELKSVKGAGSLAGTEELRAAQVKSDELASQGKLVEARDILLQFAHDHPASYAGDRAMQGANALARIAADRLEDLLGVARAAADRKDWQAALEAAARAVATAPPGDPLQRARAEQARIRGLIPGTAPMDPVPADPGPAKKPPVAEKPPEKPPEKQPDKLPEPPKKEPPSREEEANELFRASREALEAGRFGDAERGFYRMFAEYRDSKMVRDYGAEVEQRYVDALKKGRGVAGLFRGNLQFRGNRVSVGYTFENAAEMDDWETIATFAVPQKGIFKAEGGELAGEGAASFMMRAAFKPESVTMSFRVRPGSPAQDVGAMMAEPKDIANNVLFMIGNEFFKLGKGTGAYALPGNVIFVFGKGMWKDTDPGMVGFVKTATSEEPKVPPRKWTEVEVSKEKDKAKMVIEGRPLAGRSVGDNKYEITGVRPALFVLLSDASFDDVTVEGELDPAWVKTEHERLFPPIK